MKKKINLITKTIIFLSVVSLFFGLFYGEDSSGSGGFIADYKNTWGYVKALQNDLFTLPTDWTVHTPLHYIFISQLNFLFQEEMILQIVFSIICLLVPMIFFLCLRIKFPKSDINILIILSSIILILPAFRSSAIWINAHATALIFFLFFLYYFLQWEKKKFENKLSINILCQLIFLALAVYTRQYYAYFYAYLMFVYLKKFNLLNFIKISLLVSLLSIPGFILIFKEPAILKSTFDLNLSNTILISSSIMSFYLIPFYFIRKLNFKNSFLKMKTINSSTIYFILFLLIFTLFLNLFFNYNYKVGGGFFLKLSYLLLDNNYLFLLSSYAGFIFLFDFLKKDKNNLFLIMIFLLGFSAYMIFQKYFEPIFFMIILLMMNNNLISDVVTKLKNVYFLYFYFLIYLIVAIVNDVFKITRILI